MSPYSFPFLMLGLMPIECNTKSSLPPRISCDLAKRLSKSCSEVASAGITSAPQVFASSLILPMRMGKINELAKTCGAEVIPADATSEQDLDNLFAKSQEILGGKLDFVLHSIGMSPNIRKGKEYGDMNYDWYLKTLDISALSFHKILQTCEKQDALNEYGSVVGLSYIAAQRAYPDYTDMAQAKAMLESIARSYGQRYGVKKKVRVNTISQSPTKTTAGAGISGFDVFFYYAQLMSPLGNATAEDFAKQILVVFSDFTLMVTIQ